MKRFITLMVCMAFLPACTVKYRCQEIPNDSGCRNMSEVYDRTGDAFLDDRGQNKKAKIRLGILAFFFAYTSWE